MIPLIPLFVICLGALAVYRASLTLHYPYEQYHSHVHSSVKYRQVFLMRRSRKIWPPPWWKPE